MWTITLLSLVACKNVSEVKGGEKPEVGNPDSKPVWDDSGDLAPPPALIKGSVLVNLYSVDDAGVRTEVPWPAELTSFPYGQIYISGYTIADQGMLYYGEDVLRYPTAGWNAWEMEVDATQVDALSFYGVLDYNNDGILAPGEPAGLGKFGLEISPGGTYEDINFIIDVPWDPTLLEDDGNTGTGGHTGAVDIPDPTDDPVDDGIVITGGGAEIGDGVSIEGDVHITQSYQTGRVVVMLFDTDMVGPYEYDWVQPQAIGNGAMGTWQVFADPNFGDAVIKSAWDNNRNGVIDPSDIWGEYGDGSGGSKNPLTIGDQNLEGVDVWIPMGNALSVIPFVVYSGKLKSETGFGSYKTVYVAALKSNPTAGMEGALLAKGYDVSWWQDADLQTNELAFSLVMPTNTYTYLAAFADADGDGLILEPDEPLAYWNGGAVLNTGSSNVTDIHMTLQAPPQGEN